MTRNVDLQLLGIGQGIIVEELRKIPEFRQRMVKLADRFPDMALVEGFEYPLDIMIFYERIRQDDTELINRMLEYTAALEELAYSFNLRCDWIVTGLHYMLRNIINPNIKVEISNWGWSMTIDRLKLDIPIDASTRKEDVQHIFDKEWERIKSNHPELQERARLPDNFDLHVRWLCQRLFFGKTGKTMDDNYDLDYINASIRKAAKRLFITLPRGRPKTHAQS